MKVFLLTGPPQAISEFGNFEVESARLALCSAMVSLGVPRLIAATQAARNHWSAVTCSMLRASAVADCGAGRRAPHCCAARRTISSETLQRKSFWHEMYANNKDVFTLDQPNPNLVKYMGEMLPGFPSAAKQQLAQSQELCRVLVPGCGRDCSMLWMLKQGLGVVGVDYVGEPLRQLGNVLGGLDPVLETDRYMAYQGPPGYRRLVLVHGDLASPRGLQPPDDFGGAVDAVWDRASLTSIPKEDRQLYASNLYNALKPGGRVLLEYLASNVLMDGAMDPMTARHLMEGAGFTVKELKREDVRDQYQYFNPPGLLYLDEIVLLAMKT